MNKVAESKKKHSDKFVGAKVIYAPFKKDVTSIAPLEEIKDFAGELAGIDLVGHDEKYPVSQYTGFVVEAQFKQNLAAYLQAGETEWRTYTDEGLVSAHFIWFFQFITYRAFHTFRRVMDTQKPF